MAQTIDIIIPSYNGKHLLQKHLPDTVTNSPEAENIIVVDDGSCDGTAEYVQKNFPSVIFLHHKNNLGFTKSVNLGVSASKADFIVLLNNDVSPQKDYLKSAIKHFIDDELFAVTFNEKNSSWPEVAWENGKLQFTRGEDKTALHVSAWASGGSSIIRRSLWDKVGGFDEVYSPAYWEDIDLGWRAWKMGFKIIWDPNAKVLHEHEASYSKFRPGYISTIKQRNEIIFNWRNITDQKYINSHRHHMLNYCLAHPGYIRIVLVAYIRSLLVPRVNKFICTDKTVFELLKTPIR